MKRFAVIGLGKFGSYVARALYEGSNEVVAIDYDRNRVQAIDPHVSESVVLDATNKESLENLGLEDMDAVIVSIGSRISNSILICLYLQEAGVKKIIARAMDEDHEKILRRVGATKIIHPERDVAEKLSRELAHPNILDYIPLARNFELLQTEAPRDFVNKSLKDLDLRARYNVHIIAIKEPEPEKFTLVPPAEYVIKSKDILIMLGKETDIDRIRELD